MQYRSTRYKIITRIVATNSLLEKMKITDTNACEYCKERENIEHKYWHCPKVQSFWNELKTLLVRNEHSSLAEKVNIKFVILGGDDNSIMNHVISVGIQMIHSGKELSLTLLMTILKCDMQSEHYQANIKGQINVFNQKWSTLDFLGRLG